MRRTVYGAGRLCQVLGLLALPSAIWVAELEHSERGAVTIFAASLGVFAAGTLLVRLVSRP